MATPTQISGDAADYIAEYGWSGFIQNVILGGIVLGTQIEVLEGIDSAGDLLLAPVRALGSGFTRLVSATIGNVISVFDAGTQATVLSFTDGMARALGPLAQPTAVGVGMLSIGVFVWSINRLEISPWSFVQKVRS